MSIIVTNLKKRFGDNLVVNNVSLEVVDGDLFVLLGGSGSGKSTILRMIAGLIQPDSGRIELNGRDVTYLPPQARGTGFVFQNYSIFRHMSVSENVEFGLRIRKVPSAKRRQRSAELLDLVGLAGLGGRYPDQLSGGQQQRVALARALAYEPAVLLLDEPFGALDVKIRAQLRKSLREIQQQVRVTTILVTHDQEEAFELANHIGVVERGRLVETGTPEKLYHRPKTEFTAIFIGGGNVLAGRKEDEQIRLGSVYLPLPSGAPDHEEGAPIRILFRPETVAIQPEPFSPQQGICVLGQGQVVEQVFAGSLERILLRVEDLRGARSLQPEPAYGQRSARIAVVRTSGEFPGGALSLGQRVWIGLREYHVLNPSGLKVLIHAGATTESEAALDYGLKLAHSAGGPATLLGLANSPAEVAEKREQLESLSRSWQAQLHQLETRVRQGRAEQVLQEARQGDYELVVLAQSEAIDHPGSSELNITARNLLLQAGIAVLLVQDSRPEINRVLICTAGGEPGKSDVRFGGRLARRTGAQATVFHVRREGVGEDERKLADRHLSLAQASLESLGVRSETKTMAGLVIPTILAEVRQGDYDLIVIGAPAPQLSTRLFHAEFAGRIISGTRRPVVVVPMPE